MRVLVVGGAGLVGSLVVPLLRERLDLTVFDLVEPSTDVPFVQGSVRDPAALRAALQGHDCLLYMAMGATAEWGSAESSQTHFDVNVTGLHQALRAAAEVGIRHAVHVSTMSVYAQLLTRRIDDEGQPPDAVEFYGLSKRLGEDVCRAACREHGMSVNSLRICLPVSAEEWRRQFLAGTQTIHTEAGDVARAILAALRGFGGFQAFHISGDWRERTMNLAKARAMLGWNVYHRPVLLSPTAPAEFSMGQFWRPQPEPDFRPANVAVRFADGRLLVDATLTDDDVTSQVDGPHQRTWELGDVFEIFVGRDDAESYQEVHVTPNNHVLHLRFDDAGHTRRIGGDLTLVAGAPDDVESSTARTATGWSVAAAIRVDARPGDLLRVSFGRYDASTTLPHPVLSSSSPHPFVDFHRPSEWQLCWVEPS